jgi:CubicO group peptidase (beta-lactamase class C family)
MSFDVPISGFVAAGFEPVRDAFAANFSEQGELGAEVSVYFGDRHVVDLWGGYQDHDRTQPWKEDTVVLVYSASKGLAALCLALLHSRGLLDYNERVSTYWPDFSQNNKADITVRQLLNHQAGLALIDAKLSPELISNWEQLESLLAKQPPIWEPGSFHGYHAFTIGFYMSALVRHIDPKGRRLQQFFREDIAEPLGIEFYMGLPEDFPQDRIAKIRGFSKYRTLLQIHKLPLLFFLEAALPGTVVNRVIFNPNLSNPSHYDTPEYHNLEMASATGIGQARAIAKVYATFANGGKALNLREETFDTLIAPTEFPESSQKDVVLKQNTAYHLGLGRQSDLYPLPNERCFGFPGASGSNGFADPDLGLGFGYTTNAVRLNTFGDPRGESLIKTCYQCIDSLS